MTTKALAENTPNVIIPMDDDHWRKLRSQGIGASEVAAVINKNPYKTPYELWMDKTGRNPEFEGNKFTRAGKILEDAIVRFFKEEKPNINIVPGFEDNILFVDRERPYLRVTPDRVLQFEDIKQTGPLECKNTMMRIDEDSISPTWFIQNICR